jgi:3-dehydroquinate synthase
MTRIDVGGAHPYPVMVGRGVLGELAGLVGGAQRVAVVHAAPVAALAGSIADVLRAHGLLALTIEVPDAEAGKSVHVAGGCWEELGRQGFTRTDILVGVGGGAVTDLTGFVAACWLRGVAWVAVPTSLLGMVDAAVGGKTAVNTAAGKNLVGAFHPPISVVCELSTLDTLDVADHVAGLAEVVKCGFIADPQILTLIEHCPAGALDTSSAVLHELIERSVRVKAGVVSADLRERGLREILNYGHTLAHAIEKVEGFTIRHGHAVAIGLVYAAALGLACGRLDAPTAERHRQVLELVGLPVHYAADAWPELLTAMRVDKKSRGARLRFVVLDGLARPSILDGPAEELLSAAYRKAFS